MLEHVTHDGTTLDLGPTSRATGGRATGSSSGALSASSRSQSESEFTTYRLPSVSKRMPTGGGI